MRIWTILKKKYTYVFIFIYIYKNKEGKHQKCFNLFIISLIAHTYIIVIKNKTNNSCK